MKNNLGMLQAMEIGLDGEFHSVAADMVRQQLAGGGDDLGLTFTFNSAVYGNLAYQRALQEELAQRDKYRTAAAPGTAVLPLLLRQKRIRVDMDVWLNEKTTPNGRVKLNGEAFRLKFRSFDIALDRQFQVSSREWREWVYETVGPQYRSSLVAAPDDLNARAAFSSLCADNDRHCERGAVVGDIAAWLIWDDQHLTAAYIIREQGWFELSVARTALGYRCLA